MILTDQYILDSYQCVKRFSLESFKAKKHVIKTDVDYKRYQPAKDGISPRGIPGHGEGLVCVDSDEHDQFGHITEDLQLRSRMVEKRLKKMDQLRKESLEPVLIGGDQYKTLIVGCGSTCRIIMEALNGLNLENVSFLYLKQIHPFHESLEKYLANSEKNIIVENNATSQMGRLIKLETGIEMDSRILKYNGLPFSVEELRENIQSRLD
jgi:2-oxoglutarate ferredoxin oxidoreductase subunit alpha